MAETKLARAERHVREGAERIARQQALIARLTRDGHDNMLFQARDFLVQFEAVQATFEDHLARHQAEAAEVSQQNQAPIPFLLPVDPQPHGLPRS